MPLTLIACDAGPPIPRFPYRQDLERHNSPTRHQVGLLDSRLLGCIHCGTPNCLLLLLLSWACVTWGAGCLKAAAWDRLMGLVQGAMPCAGLSDCWAALIQSQHAWHQATQQQRCE